MKRSPILTRAGYVERINDAYAQQGMGIATHSVLLAHDAALRTAVRTKAEELLIEAALRWAGLLGPTFYLGDRELMKVARAVERERKGAKP